MNFYEYLSTVCEYYNTTIDELCNRIDVSAYERSTWKHIGTIIERPTLQKIANSLNMTIDQLLASYYDTIDVSAFDKQIWGEILEKDDNDECKAIVDYILLRELLIDMKDLDTEQIVSFLSRDQEASETLGEIQEALNKKYNAQQEKSEADKEQDDLEEAQENEI